MSSTLLTVFVILLLAVLLYFAGRLAWMIGFLAWVVVTASPRARAQLRREFANLDTNAIRQKLLAEPYFESSIRTNPEVEEFLARIRAGDEIALRQRYSRARLYRMLVRAERAAGRRSRPEAMDWVDTIYVEFDELARRARIKPSA